MKFPAFSRLREKFKDATKIDRKKLIRAVDTAAIAASLATAGYGVGTMATHIPQTPYAETACKTALQTGGNCTAEQMKATLKNQENTADFQHGSDMLLLAGIYMMLIGTVFEKRQQYTQMRRVIDVQNELIDRLKDRDIEKTPQQKAPKPPAA